MSECKICHGAGRIHRGSCPKFLRCAGPCSCIPAPCFLCAAKKRDIALTVVLFLGIALILLALIAAVW